MAETVSRPAIRAICGRFRPMPVRHRMTKCGRRIGSAVAWSRTVLDAHTWPQVVVGAALGALAAAGVLPLLR
jgi:hypothetical protein